MASLGWGFPDAGSCCCSAGTCTVRKLDTDGNKVWAYLSTKPPSRRVRPDSTNGMAYVYSGTAAGGQVLEKLDADDGSLVFSNSVATSTASSSMGISETDGQFYYMRVSGGNLVSARDFSNSAVFTDQSQSGSIYLEASAGYLYLGDGTTNLNRINISTGAVIWNNGVVGSHSGIAIDSTGQVWIRQTNAVRPLAIADGTLGTALTFSGTTFYTTPHWVHIANSDKFYVGGRATTNSYVAELNTSAVKNWESSWASTANIQNVFSDSSGNVYASYSTFIRKYNSSGTHQWTFDHGASVLFVEADTSGNVYLCGNEAAV